jgi:hypothetical protein
MSAFYRAYVQKGHTSEGHLTLKSYKYSDSVGPHVVMQRLAHPLHALDEYDDSNVGRDTEYSNWKYP